MLENFRANVLKQREVIHSLCLNVVVRSKLHRVVQFPATQLH